MAGSERSRASNPHDPVPATSPFPGLLAVLDVGVVLRDADGRVVDANRAALDLLGMTRDELTALDPLGTVWDTVHEDGSPFPDDERPAVVTLQTGEPCSDVIIGLALPRLGRRWLSVSSQLVAVEGMPRAAAMTFFDVSARVAERRALHTFSQLSSVLVNATDEVAFLHDMCDALVQTAGYALAWFCTANDDPRRTVDILASAGTTGYLYDGIVSWSEDDPHGRGPTGIALRTGVTQVANDLAHQPTYEPWRDRVRALGLAASIAIPLRLADGQRAALTIYGTEVGVFDGPAAALLTEMATQFGYGILHLRAQAALQRALEGSVAALAQVTEARDPYTSGHQVRVGDLSAAIATGLGLSPSAVNGILMAGRVHDIGKIAIPAEILSKPGSLDPIEFALAKRHPEVGHKILTASGLPWPLADVALQHHERLDGSGYPSGLRGDEICQPARIVAVADVVEAMSQHRPYRPALGTRAALAEVSAGAGTLFDAAVVDACLTVFAAGFTFRREV